MAEEFAGFPPPTKNFFSLPNEMINIIAHIKNVAELKVIIYVIRHTWGYHEYGIYKTISVDEFMRGRRKQDGSRMDEGTGLSQHSVIEGLRMAVQHGYLICEVDASDLARVKKSYALRMIEPSANFAPPEETAPDAESSASSAENAPGSANSAPLHANFAPRSEKDTNRNTPEKDTLERQENAPISFSEEKRKRDTNPRIPVVTPPSKDEDVPTEKMPVVKPPKQTPGADSPPAATPQSSSNASSQALPTMALTAKQIEKQLQKRVEEIFALYEQKIGRKPSHSKANKDGALLLAQDDVSDEDIKTTIDEILKDSFLAKNLSLTFVHSKLDALARKPIPIQQNNKAPAKDSNIGVSGLPKLQTRRVNYA